MNKDPLFTLNRMFGLKFLVDMLRFSMNNIEAVTFVFPCHLDTQFYFTPFIPKLLSPLIFLIVFDLIQNIYSNI
jgi:hypothetical protein